jgi:hypothetical protein
VRNNYQRKERKSNHKFEVAGRQELLVRVPLPIAEVWAEMQAQVKELTGQAGLRIGPIPLRAACAGKAAGLCGFCWTENSAGTTAGTNP